MISEENFEHERERLNNLRSYEILDSATDADFDNLTKLASAICGTPIAIISLVDEHRQWFKSTYGLPGKETPRNVSFCTHALGNEEVFEVRDATKDPRFAKNPFVVDAPKIRFYAGAPLTTPEGYDLGTLCVVDDKPRSLSPFQMDALKILAHQVVELIQLRKLNKDLSLARKMLIEEQGLLVNRARKESSADMASDVCHQINNPLAIIFGHTLILKNRLKEIVPPDDMVFREVKIIEDTVSRVSEVLRTLRIFGGQSDQNIVKVDINEVVENILTLQSNSIHDAEILLSYDKGPPVQISANRDKISDAISLLIERAISCLRESQVKVLRVKNEIVDSHFLVTISDTGNGIRDENRDKVFLPDFLDGRIHRVRSIIRENQGELLLLKLRNPTTFQLNIPMQIF